MKEANKAAKKAVAESKAAALQDTYENLESREGQKRIFKIAKERNKASKDMTSIKQIKVKNGVVHTNPDMIRKRWQEHYDGLLNQENGTYKRG